MIAELKTAIITKWQKLSQVHNVLVTAGSMSTIHTADADVTKLFCRVSGVNRIRN